MYLYFTEDEMIKFLEKRGYTVMTIDTWKIASRSEEIHNGTAFTKVTVKCMFKNNYPKDDKNLDSYAWLNTYGIEMVFSKELKKTILSL